MNKKRERGRSASDKAEVARAEVCLKQCFGQVPGRCVIVVVSSQRLVLLVDGEVECGFRVSTAKVGIDAREGSHGTPPGVHRIARKIGAGMPAGTIFRTRVPTGDIWLPGAPEEADDDLILTRILTLEGLEDGINRGPGVDTLARYVYIHGTNHEGRLGVPVSGGCIRMGNADIIGLFERVEEGDPVVII
jgi:hypothetical protein